ncbi:C2H2 transcription factor [Calycina marina]|uniref:C2H2 transcription factor n=1 Tax=Calycina marina TaxID=1763456 RepID=A0A9P8CCR4_9HELO|nr:C2H2 transcription factor [Calycina marina]
MSLSYESTNYMQESRYPVMMHEDTTQQEQDLRALQHASTSSSEVQDHRYPSPPIAGVGEDPYQPHNLDSDVAAAEQQVAQELQNIDEIPTNNDIHHEDIPPEEQREPSPIIQKPEREFVRENGRFICTFEGCTEEKRDFGRKCEWSKHMDKHDRPYKCLQENCAKLPGFTYSGGLLRHQREVHNQHGGPKKQLNCPHATCKRHHGKGFSRMENLTEHLRRVHTDNMLPLPPAEDEMVEAANDVGGAKTGQKRKRAALQLEEQEDVHEEVKRLRHENTELRQNLDYMEEQLRQMQNMHQEQALEQLQRDALQGLTEVQQGGMPQARMQ